MADLSDGPNACCAEERLLVCCEEREKADCCGPGGERCGCDVAHLEPRRAAPSVSAGEPAGERI